MKLGSKYFDSIRAAPRRERAEEQAGRRHPGCQWKGCGKPAGHRAPMGRGRDGEYFNFCLDHVREYNAAYNYFDGMSDNEVADFQKDALTGHRPTWKLGVNSSAPEAQERRGRARFGTGGVPPEADPHGLFEGDGEDAASAVSGAGERRRHLRPLERKALDALHLTDTATKVEIKARFKELVKRHHPDANGGDNRSEDKLREIIQAYNYLKQAGLV